MKKLGFGLMRLPLTDGDDPKSIDQNTLNQMIDYFLEQGFTYFDTAYAYHQGLSETAARKGLVERHKREEFLLADKMPVWLINSHNDYEKIFNEQLERTGVTYFDYYLLHTMGEKHYANTLKHDGFSFMKKVKAEGRAKHIGMSFHDKAAVLDTILTEHPEIEFVQLQINYVDWEDKGIEARKCYEVAVKHNKPIIVMEPVKGGSLAVIPKEAEEQFKAYHSELSVASWAIRYAASLEQVFMVLSGMSNFEQMEDNTSFMKEFKPLSEEENKIVFNVADFITNSIAIGCTACQYCVEGCPKKIPIPNYFSLYNNQKQFGFKPLHNHYYMNLAEKHGKASDCIGCKKCEAHCPQHIEIVDRLKDVVAVFEG